jgi:hypothetical protein
MTIRRHYWQHWENKTQDEDRQGQSGDTTGNKKQDEDRQGQSEDTTDNIGKTRHRMKTYKTVKHNTTSENKKG